MDQGVTYRTTVFFVRFIPKTYLKKILPEALFQTISNVSIHLTTTNCVRSFEGLNFCHKITLQQ